MPIGEMLAETIPEWLLAGKPNVVGSIIIVEYVDSELVTKVTDPQSGPVFSVAPEQPEGATTLPGVPCHCVTVPEEAVAADEPAFRSCFLFGVHQAGAYVATDLR